MKFKNPPINELVIGAYFDRDIPLFQPEYVGIFWDHHRLSFPKISQQAPLARPYLGLSIGAFPIADITGMSRYWLESTDETTLIQIQANAFLLNWRRRDREYPHFDTVKGLFDSLIKNFFGFIAEYLNQPAPRVQLTELTYINAIEPCEYWKSLEDTSRVLPRFSIPVPTSNELGPADFHQITIDKVASDMTLITTVRSARAPNEPVRPMLVFELRAIGLIQENGTLDEWFRRAHDLTGDRFQEMTNSDIQTTYWQPE